MKVPSFTSIREPDSMLKVVSLMTFHFKVPPPVLVMVPAPVKMVPLLSSVTPVGALKSSVAPAAMLYCDEKYC